MTDGPETLLSNGVKISPEDKQWWTQELKWKKTKMRNLVSPTVKNKRLRQLTGSYVDALTDPDANSKSETRPSQLAQRLPFQEFDRPISVFVEITLVFVNQSHNFNKKLIQ